ncbi:YdeI/OmpD-associated family protein [Lysobacter solisilvae (ex Woo and Kim 2020)]|uniref:YdeI/OmpD-associated family protein n=1 Tax=Agrilutibacter terrestris TaxID=2865112 RepID=A0A7H0FX43_9GAMM|nr:YdeI/OmpD-associated family protein [Lysobacter terrestris]QNP40609.1 YdeI/OmpD-associated family protein [Lysobacter terrestris]
MGQRDPRIDAYIASAAGFAQPILTHLRGLVHAACPDCEETLKWSAPSFTYRGKILCGMAAFKQHATFGLWQGAAIVAGDGSRRDEAMGQFGRLTRVADLPGKRELVAYLRQGMQLIDAGATRTPARNTAPKPPVEAPDDLLAALRGNARARATFEAFPPSCQREYVEWITEAKREATRASRLAQTIEWLAEGKRRNWKYEKC